MSTPVDRIKTLIESLPQKDIPWGYKFIEERDFEQLKDLVDSAIFKVKKDQKSDTPKEEYKNVNLDSLRDLKTEVDAYIMLLDPLSEEDYSEYNNEEDDELEEEFY